MFRLDGAFHDTRRSPSAGSSLGRGAERERRRHQQPATYRIHTSEGKGHTQARRWWRGPEQRGWRGRDSHGTVSDKHMRTSARSSVKLSEGNADDARQPRRP